jgi:hypothetical protein
VVSLRNNFADNDGPSELVSAKRSIERCVLRPADILALLMLNIRMTTALNIGRYGLSDREGIIKYTSLLRFCIAEIRILASLKRTYSVDVFSMGLQAGQNKSF